MEGSWEVELLKGDVAVPSWVGLMTFKRGIKGLSPALLPSPDGHPPPELRASKTPVHYQSPSLWHCYSSTKQTKTLFPTAVKENGADS